MFLPRLRACPHVRACAARHPQGHRDVPKEAGNICSRSRNRSRRTAAAAPAVAAPAVAAPAAAAPAAAVAAAATFGVIVVCPYEGPTTTLDWSKAWKAEVVAHTAHWNPGEQPGYCQPRLAVDGRTYCTEHKRLCTLNTTDCNPDAPEEASAVPPVATLPGGNDAAVLRIKSSLSTGVSTTLPITVGGSPLKILRLSETVLDDPYDTMQSLASLGFPPGGGLVSATPILVQFSEKLDDTFLKLTGSEMMPGHSGGPLMTMSSVVVGWNVRNRSDMKLYSHCKMIAVARKCIELALPTGVTWSNLLASEDEEKAHAEQQRASIAAIGGQAAAVSEKSAKQAAKSAKQSAKAAASSETAAASSEMAAASSKKAAASSETAAAVSAAHAVGAASTVMEIAGQVARQAETEVNAVNLAAMLRVAVQGMGVDDPELQLALLMNITSFVKQVNSTRTDLQALPAGAVQLLAAHASASVLLVIEMPLVLAQAIMELARGRDPGLVELGIRCCQLGEEVVPLGDENSFTKYAQELRDIPATTSDPGGKGSFLVTTANRITRKGIEHSLAASAREVQAFRQLAEVLYSSASSETAAASSETAAASSETAAVLDCPWIVSAETIQRRSQGAASSRDDAIGDRHLGPSRSRDRDPSRSSAHLGMVIDGDFPAFDEENFKRKLAKLLGQDANWPSCGITAQDISIRPAVGRASRVVRVRTGSCEVHVSCNLSGCSDATEEDAEDEEDRIKALLKQLIENHWPREVQVSNVRVIVSMSG
eukprot:scaffold59039_cov65-Phaeocystis_antarctica.AAC.2